MKKKQEEVVLDFFNLVGDQENLHALFQDTFHSNAVQVASFLQTPLPAINRVPFTQKLSIFYPSNKSGRKIRPITFEVSMLLSPLLFLATLFQPVELNDDFQVKRWRCSYCHRENPDTITICQYCGRSR